MGVMYGRGVDDDKGTLLPSDSRSQTYIREHGDFNIIFMMEEGQGPLRQKLRLNIWPSITKRLRADLLVWEARQS